MIGKETYSDVNQGKATITSTLTKILSKNEFRIDGFIHNEGAYPVTISFAKNGGSVGFGDTFILKSGGHINLNSYKTCYVGEVWGICDTGQTATIYYMENKSLIA